MNLTELILSLSLVAAVTATQLDYSEELDAESSEALCRYQMRVVGHALEVEHIQSGRYPDDIAGLTASAFDDADFADPWGNAYDYEVTDFGCVLSSAGADGEAGNDDDIVLRAGI